MRDFSRRDRAFRRLARQVVGAQVPAPGAEFFKPEQRHLREECALARNRLAQNDVEGTEPVAGHHEQAVGSNRIVVAYFAARQQVKTGDR